MKKQMLLMPKAGVGFPLIMTFVAVCQAVARSENSTGARRRGVAPIVFQAAGPTAESIQSTVDAFRAAVGEPNNANTPGPLPVDGRREINWDGGGSDATTAPVTPFDVFLSTRGARFTTRGKGLSQAPPAGGAQGGLATLFNNPTYGDIFAAFSPLRLFTPVRSNITEGTFFIPGTNGATPAKVTAFGAVFTDVDRQDGAEENIEGIAGRARSSSISPPMAGPYSERSYRRPQAMPACRSSESCSTMRGSRRYASRRATQHQARMMMIDETS